VLSYCASFRLESDGAAQPSPFRRPGNTRGADAAQRLASSEVNFGAPPHQRRAWVVILDRAAASSSFFINISSSSSSFLINMDQKLLLVEKKVHHASDSCDRAT
jgi:hypothetical protein